MGLLPPNFALNSHSIPPVKRLQRFKAAQRTQTAIMAPNKWDEESEEDSTPPTSPAPPVARRKFDDEESEEDVLDDWEAAEDSEVEREKAKKAEEAEAKANHKPKTKRIEDRIAERKRRAAEAGETSE